MTTHGFALFDSPIGTCGLVWSERGIAGLQLPENKAAATRARVQRRWPDAEEVEPPPAIGTAIERILALLGGASDDLGNITLDLDAAPDFHRQVYEVARTIPPGQTLTYGEIAKRLGAPHESREVGQALGRNPVAIIVPCHRVLGRDGALTGYAGGLDRKTALLTLEHAAAPTEPAMD